MNYLKNPLLATTLAAVLCLGTASISFGQNLVVNGNFSSMSPSSTNGKGLDAPGYTGGVTLTSWSNSGYNFVFTGTNKGDTSIKGSSGDFALWGPNNGSNNGLVRPPGSTNFVAADGAFEVGPLTQVVSGLTAGKTYAVSFDWAGAQQESFNGTTQESWSVALGGAGFTAGPNDESGTLAGAQTTATVTNASHGFTGWMSQTFNFTAASSSETLYFLANGTPTGQPPFSLLANVNMTAVPEASTYWTIVLAMLIMVGTRFWRGYQKKLVANA